MHFNWLISDHCQPEMESAQWLPRNVQLRSKLETAFLTLMLDKANFGVRWKFKWINNMSKICLVV